jgi:hypothetical protein
MSRPGFNGPCLSPLLSDLVPSFTLSLSISGGCSITCDPHDIDPDGEVNGSVGGTAFATFLFTRNSTTTQYQYNGFMQCCPKNYFTSLHSSGPPTSNDGTGSYSTTGTDCLGNMVNETGNPSIQFLGLSIAYDFTSQTLNMALGWTLASTSPAFVLCDQTFSSDFFEPTIPMAELFGTHVFTRTIGNYTMVYTLTI